MGSFHPPTQPAVTSLIPIYFAFCNIVKFPTEYASSTLCNPQQYKTRARALRNRLFVVLRLLTVGKIIWTLCKCISYDKILNKGKILFILHPTFKQIS